MSPPAKTAFIWDPASTRYRFSPTHPFNPKRLELTVSLIEAMGLVGGEHTPVIAPRMATEEELLTVHSAEFVRAVQEMSRADADPGQGWQWGLGTDDNPVFPGMHDAASLIVGGTLRAAELVMGGEVTRAFTVAGGLHHAHRDRASGFCIYSDLSAAIRWMRDVHGARVMYIDYDAHHGDGVQGIFYDDPQVLTVSLHEHGRYLFPGTGFVDELGEGDGYGYSINAPLEPFTEDDSWISLQNDLLPELTAAFRPDVIVLMNGVDGHLLDPLTHLRATTRLYEETTRLVVRLADEHCGGRLVATGGGGYAIWQVVPRAWALVWSVLSGQDAPDEIPRAWIERWQGESPQLLPERLRDEPGMYAEVPRRPQIEAANLRTLAELRRTALPLLRGWGMGY
jgi:acetoin utilization protein AcuC